jgi:uncharacterized membrane protein YgcG
MWLERKDADVLRRLMLLALLIIWVSVSQVASAQDQSLVWERWDVEIGRVDTAANEFVVREIYDVRFEGAFRFGSAVIPSSRLETIGEVSVVVDGVQLTPACFERPGTFCFDRDGVDFSITYYFPQLVVDERIDIEIVYTVYGALRSYPDGDQLWWDAIPEDHFGFPIRNSTVTVILPSEFAPREGIDPIETYGAPGEVSVRGSTITATATNGVGEYEGFSVRIQYPHDPRGSQPYWQAQFDEQRSYEENVQPLLDLGLPLLSGLFAFGGLGVVLLRYQARGRDPKVLSTVPEYIADPPSELSPGLVGVLLDERADVRDVIAVVLDLARRGYIVIEESRDKAGFLGIATSRFVFKRTDKPIEELRRFEQVLMQRLFEGQLERTLESLRNKFYLYVPELERLMYQAALDEGLFDRSPANVRAAWSSGGGALLIMGLVTGFLSLGYLQTVSVFLFCAPAALALVGFGITVFGSYMPAKTEKGALEAAKWRSFNTYMRNLERYASIDEASARLADYIPYAIAFGMSSVWLARFRDVSVSEVPPWYFPTHLGGPYRRVYVPGSPVTPHTGMGRGVPGEIVRADDGEFSMDDMSRNLAAGMNSMATGLDTMINSAARVLTSQPQASGSSGSWRSGGGGFSGGGSRGGGGSGGGSRGFG